jgi:hypothetical protein
MQQNQGRPPRPITPSPFDWHRNLLPAGVATAAWMGPVVSIKYTERPVEASTEPSVGGLGDLGDSYDNTVAETINGLYEVEVIHRRGPWRWFEAVEFATLDGSTGSTIGASSSPSATSHRHTNKDTTPCWSSPESPIDLIQSASGAPGAVQPNHSDRLFTRHAPICIAVATAGS